MVRPGRVHAHGWHRVASGRVWSFTEPGATAAVARPKPHSRLSNAALTPVPATTDHWGPFCSCQHDPPARPSHAGSAVCLLLDRRSSTASPGVSYPAPRHHTGHGVIPPTMGWRHARRGETRTTSPAHGRPDAGALPGTRKSRSTPRVDRRTHRDRAPRPQLQQLSKGQRHRRPDRPTRLSRPRSDSSRRAHLLRHRGAGCRCRRGSSGPGRLQEPTPWRDPH